MHEKLADKLDRISKFESAFRKHDQVLLFLKLVTAKTHLQTNLHEKCHEILTETQNELSLHRSIPKQVLSLLNEVWAAYHWQREHYLRCHQSLLSFLVYSDLNKLSLLEKREVIYRLIICNHFLIFYEIVYL